MFFIYFFLISFGLIILNMEILSLFKGINFLNVSILTGLWAFVGIIFICAKKPKINFKAFIKDLKASFIEDKWLFVLSCALVFMLFISFLLSIMSPPTEADAQSYHCLRALFFAKDGFIHHFETADIRCHCMPINSELFYTWLLILFKKDTSFGLLQYFSYFLLIISSFKLMDLFNIEFKKRIYSILIFSSFAGVISQISSTQTDLCTGSLLVTSIFLTLKYSKDKTKQQEKQLNKPSA